MARLDTLAGRPQAQLDGFKSRALRARAPTQRHLYTVEWSQYEATEGAGAEVLTVGDVESMEWEALPSRVSQAELATTLRTPDRLAVAAAVATRRGAPGVLPLFAVEVALALVQALAATMPMLTLWLLTGEAHAGSWGLARTARAEAWLPVVCLDAPVNAALLCGPSFSEPEAAVHERNSCVPRLTTVPSPSDGLVRLHFHARGAVSNLFIEPQPAVSSVVDGMVVLRVRAVGLNFRDVLNVLGEYPGDPGPPGGDAAGIVVEAASPLQSVFGLGHAPLACEAGG